MTELVLNSNSLPEPLFRLIRSEKVKVCEQNGVVQLLPILDTKNGCPLLGIANDSNFTVDSFLASKINEKSLEL